MIWYKKLGFTNNPFSVKPAAYEPNLVAYDMDFIYKKIDNAEMLFIEGEYGTGKTTILKNLIARYKGKNKIIYFNFDDGAEFDLRRLVDGANSVLGRVTGLKVRNMLLFLDEAHTISKKEAQNVLKYYESGILKSVVLVSHDVNGVSMPEEMKIYLKDNIIKTTDLNTTEAEELIKSRIGDTGLFPQNITKMIFNLAGKNPRKFLEYCEDVARFAVDMDDYKILEFHVNSVLGKPMDKSVSRSTAKKFTKNQVSQEANMPEIEASRKLVTPKVNAARGHADTRIKVAVGVKKKRPIPGPIEKEMPAVAVAEELPDKEVIFPKVAAEEVKVREIDSSKEDVDSLDAKQSKQKKYKVNKLVEGSKEPLGTVEAKESEGPKADGEEIPEYKVFVFDN